MSKPPNSNQSQPRRRAPARAKIDDDKPNSNQKSSAGKTRRNWIEKVAVIFAAVAGLATSYQGYVATDVEHRQLRAYVGILPGDVENYGTADQKVHFSRKNYGQTPAYDLIITEIGQFVIHQGQPVPSDPVKTDPNIARGTPTLFPSIDLPFHFNGLTINPNILNQVSIDKDLRFVLLGTLKYRDAFDHIHFTNFCWMYKAREMTGKDADWCLAHNDSD